MSLLSSSQLFATNAVLETIAPLLAVKGEADKGRRLGVIELLWPASTIAFCALPSYIFWKNQMTDGLNAFGTGNLVYHAIATLVCGKLSQDEATDEEKRSLTVAALVHAFMAYNFWRYIKA